MRRLNTLVFLLLATLTTLQAQKEQSELPSPIVVATAMNIVYRGIENPIEVVVPGYESSEISVTASNCTITQNKNEYRILPGEGREVVFDIKVTRNGESTSVGKRHLRVINIPDPVAFLGGIGNSDTIQGKFVLAAQGVIAKMVNFDFDLRFNLISYTMTAWVDRKPIVLRAESARITPEMKTLIARGKPELILISEVKAKGPDGSIRTLNPIIIAVKW